MSGSITGVSGAGVDAGLLGRLTQDSAEISKQLDTAMQQQSTGKVSDKYSGLGNGARTSLDLRPSVQHMQTWQNNIDSATARLDVTQSTMKQISSIASNFYAQTNNINGTGQSEVASIASSAKQALKQVAELLNTKDGNVYVFAGQDTANAPVTTTDPAVLSTDLLATPTTTAPFSSTLGTSVPTVEVGEGQTVQVGLLANQNTLSTSQAPTTGSYMRDLMTSLATLSNLTAGPTAQTTASSVRSQLGSAIDAMSTEQGSLGDLQSGLQTRKTTLASTQTSLTAQVSNVEDVDSAATITKVQSLQTQLQASYRLISGVKELSLVNYL